MPEIEDLEHLDEWIKEREAEIRNEAYDFGKKQGKKKRLGKNAELVGYAVYGAFLTPMIFKWNIEGAVVWTFMWLFFVGVLKSIIAMDDLV